MERNMAEGNEEQYFDLDKSFQELNIEELKDEEDLGCEPLLSPIVSPIKPGKRPTSKALPATPSREPPTKRTDTKATPVKEALKDDEAIRGPDQSFGTRPRPKPMVIDTSPSVLVQQSYYGATSVSSGIVA